MERIYRNKGFEYHLNNGNHTAEIVRGRIGRCSSYRIPDHVTVEGIRYTIDSVGFDAYNSPRTLKHLIIPNSITYLDENTLCFLPNLKSIHIGKGLKIINNWYFRGSPKLRIIHIDRENPNMKRCGNMIISADGKFLMTSLFQCRHYDIPGGVEEIESIAFWYITRLKSISFPTTLRKIGDNSFSNLPKIEEIRLPEGLQSCVCQSFLDCENLKLIDFPSTMKVAWMGHLKWML